MDLEDAPSLSQLASATNPDVPSSPPVFFGPVTSPEKRYAAGLPTRTPPPPSPVRRSLRLSLAHPPLFPSTPMRAVSEEEVSEVENFLESEAMRASEAEEGSSGEERNAVLDDDPEPSSALAEKISRAHDNPSPPPKFSLLPPERTSSSEPEPQASSSKLIDISFEVASPVPQRTHAGDLLAPISPFKFAATAPPPSSPNAVSSDTDLISFDDSIEVPTAPTTEVQEACGILTLARANRPDFKQEIVPTVVTVEDVPMASPVEPATSQQGAPATPPPPPPPVATQYLDITTPTPRRRSPRLSKAPATLSEPPRPSSPSPAMMAPVARTPAPITTTPPPQPSTSAQIPSPRRSASPRRQQALQQTERLASLSPTTTGLLSNIIANATPNPFNTPSVIRQPALNATIERSPSPPRRPTQLQRPPSASPEKSAKPAAPPSPAKRVPIFKPPSSSSDSFSHIPSASASHSPPRRVPITSPPSKPPGSLMKHIGTPQRIPRPRAGSAEPTGSVSPRKPSMLAFRPPSRAASDSAVFEGGKSTGIEELPFPLRAATIPEESETPEGGKDAGLAPSEDKMHDAASLAEAPPPLSDEGTKSTLDAIKSPLPSGPATGKTKSNLRHPSTLASSRIPRKPYARPASADKDKSRAKEPGPVMATTTASRALSKELIAGPSTTARPNVRAAKNPIVSKPVAPKERDVTEVSSDDAPASGPEKSVPAKVPTKGRLVKPVSREKDVEKDKGKGRDAKPATMRRAAAPAQARLIRSAIVNRTDSESSSSDTAPPPGQPVRTISPLKRKRSDDGSPSGAQAYVLLGPRTASSTGPQTMRKVVKQAPPVSAPSPSHAPAPVPTTAAPASPEKKVRGGPARKVAPATRRTAAAATKPAPPRSALPRLVKSPTPDPPALASLTSVAGEQQQEPAPVAPVEQTLPPAIVVNVPSLPASPVKGSLPKPAQMVSEPVPVPSPAPTLVPPLSPSPAPELAGGRRTRSGRTTNDVFGPIVRRGANDGGPFASMSVTALRALTTVNTTRNQNYGVAILSTEVVRKNGPRPESPQTKVRSLEEKRKEAAQRGRSERAARRARRQSGEDSTEDEGAGEGLEERSWTEERHRLGAGDDEEYVTPEKARPAKRLRFDGTDTNDEAHDNPKRERRVRWDKGLFNTVYFDNTPGPLVLPSRAASAATFPKSKGGLAGSARALRLDSLGNALSESPVKGLEPENVVVKKFLYDDDEGAEPIVQEEPVEAKGKGKRRASRS